MEPIVTVPAPERSVTSASPKRFVTLVISKKAPEFTVSDWLEAIEAISPLRAKVAELLTVVGPV